ncbi:MAG: hypothetical protein K0R55_1106 [Sporomusa sp.]|jgi:hypothetical protein|nr:hypothetical protein [Sporomusa sp.]
MLLLAAAVFTLTFLPLSAICEETTATDIVNKYVQYRLDTNINSNRSKLQINFDDDYSNFTFSFSRKFGYPVTPQLLAFSDIKFEGTRYDAFLSQANVGLEYVTKNHESALYKRIYEKDVSLERKFYFSFGARFN